ncbi:uncharacterized protein Dwil_GK17882 [Drosophila willistoni]|uniref:Uncharacterized protein n=1 Tax=Drosophila willistoni TaxID=7260 RepID=B4N5Q5_DROWI|nr:uncharacterized protein LOC6646256 [Drosophila willistoni]EDW79694.2 uncharacterized protein Dwil_GK17882 [Drosophila willistoni]
MLFASLILLLNYLQFLQAAHNPFTLRSKFTNISVEFGSDFLSGMRAWLTPQGSLNVDMHVNRTLTAGLRTSMTVQYKIGGPNQYQTLFNYDLDTCKTLEELLKTSLMRVWFRNILKYGHLTDKCPIKAGFYDVRNFQLENNSIPAYLRPGEYRVNDINYYGKPKVKNRQRLVASLTLDAKFY